MRNILRYNRRYYAAALAVIVVAAAAGRSLSQPWRTLVLAAAMPAAWWLVSSLLVSYHIYNRSPLYSLRWLHTCLSAAPRRWLNLHAGLDETSHRLMALFPSAEGRTVDIYDPREMSEPSIAEARRLATAPRHAESADWSSLPLPDHQLDAAFLIFAAHELRHEPARVRLFREIARVLRPGGELVLVEHLRDWSNFAAFGPGSLHFFSERVWQRAADAACLRRKQRISLTPFIRVFVLESL